tara:strand:+ start:2425 stop:4251 length:1827 start_codon:yes stop_codon:yes gene_type:complete
MTTAIKSTALDFNSIKNNLKTSLENSGKFTDFNFEASGISSILDVLAYNTHFNALTANFALNESFLSTAQLRSSIVSLAEGIGYIPNSRTASQAIVNLSINLSGVSGRPSTIRINENFKFNTSIDEVNYVFQTRESLVATDAESSGIYIFKDLSGSKDIKISEGTLRSKRFITLESKDNPVYVIPDKTLDLSTVVVKVFENTSTSTFTTYSNIINATVINENSTLYILKEAPNGLFELSFGNGVTLGKAPILGGRIEVEYLSVAGILANNAKTFSSQNSVTVNGVNYPVTVSTEIVSVGGDTRETIESIRKNAPFQYASQNRMVTASDYSALILKNYSSFISDIQSFGGEDALEPEYGVVFVSILFDTDDVDTQTRIKNEILQLSEQLSVASFDVKFQDPIKTFIETTTFFQFSENLTTLSRNTIQSNVNQVIDDYFAGITGKFGQSFRRSNLLTLIDDSSSAVLSSRQEIKMQRRFTPTLTAIQNHKIRYAAPIADNDDLLYTITSSAFSFRGNPCIIRNRLKTNKLEIFDTVQKVVIVDNSGDYSNDIVNIVGLQVDAFIGSDNFIKLSVTPANQSAISPLRQDIIEYDSSKSFTSIVDVTPGVTN